MPRPGLLLIDDEPNILTSLRRALEIEGFAGLFETADQTEGMTAFVEKRKADFKAE